MICHDCARAADYAAGLIPVAGLDKYPIGRTLRRHFKSGHLRCQTDGLPGCTCQHRVKETT